jgi:hypothetical protein
LDEFYAKEPQLKTSRIEMGKLISKQEHFVFQITKSIPNLFKSAKKMFQAFLSQLLNHLRGPVLVLIKK